MTMKILDRLIEILCAERGEPVPALTDDQKPNYFRALCNVRPPIPTTETFLRLQNEYLTAKTIERGIVDVENFNYKDNVALWRGDITRLNADAIVNACNAQLLGCFHPLHNCIDNVIHSNAGIQVRLDCYELTKGQEQPNGIVQVTRAYNLPSKFIFHTVGPIVYGKVSQANERDLKNCYLSCLNKADEMNLKTIAFCCIATGEFRFPGKIAAQIAVRTVREYKTQTNSKIKVVFNVFKENDYAIYKRILDSNRAIKKSIE